MLEFPHGIPSYRVYWPGTILPPAHTFDITWIHRWQTGDDQFQTISKSFDHIPFSEELYKKEANSVIWQDRLNASSAPIMLSVLT